MTSPELLPVSGNISRCPGTYGDFCGTVSAYSVYRNCKYGQKFRPQINRNSYCREMSAACYRPFNPFLVVAIIIIIIIIIIYLFIFISSYQFPWQYDAAADDNDDSNNTNTNNNNNNKLTKTIIMT